VERRDWRPLWKTALASAMWFLAGYPPSWLAFCATIFVYALASRAHWRAAVGAGLAVAASLLLSMVQFLPMLEAQSSVHTTPRYVGEANSPIIPLFVANWLDFSRGSSIPCLFMVYIYWGLAALFAIVWGACQRRLRPYWQPLVVMAFGLFLVLDPHALVYWTIVRIPLLESSAQSYNFYEGVAAMAALITATGISAFLESGPRRAAPRWLMPLVVLAMAAWSVRQLRIWAQGGAFSTGGRAVAETAIALALFAIALWTFRTASGARRACVAAAVILFALCDYKVYGTNRLFNTRDGDVDDTYSAYGIRGINDTAYRAMWTNRHYRVASDGSPSSMEFRMWGLATPQGLDPLLSKRYREIIVRWGAQFQTQRVFLMDYRNEEMLQTLGVRYAITYRDAADSAFLAASPNFQLVGSDASFYRVYEYRHARPSFGWDGAPGDARPVEWSPERRAFQVRSRRGGRFGLVEQYSPGWEAAVDGGPVAIERWREAFQSIPVGPGEHTVVFQYHSRWLPLGETISLVSLAGLVCLIAADRQSKRKRPT